MPTRYWPASGRGCRGGTSDREARRSLLREEDVAIIRNEGIPREPVRRHGHAVGLAAALCVAAAVGCQEQLTTPGACPAFCPPQEIQVADTLLQAVVRGDSTFGPYVTGEGATALHLVSEGAPVHTRAVVAFESFPLLLASPPDSILGVDSFRLSVVVLRRSPSVTGLAIHVHRLPVSADRSWAFADLEPYVTDSAAVGVIGLSDSLASGIAEVTMPASLFPSFEDDERKITVALVLRSPAVGFVDLGTLERNTTTQVFSASMTRFYSLRTGDTVVTRRDLAESVFDFHRASAAPPPDPGTLVVGGIPSVRALVRFDLPRAIMDSGSVVRATLYLVPDGAVPGAPGDTFRLRAEPLATDRGAKSPALASSGVVENSTLVFVGSADTVALDVTSIFRLWNADSTLPQAIFLRSAQEAARIAELRFSSSLGANPPALRVTYVPGGVRGGR